MAKILFKRNSKANLSALEVGEPGFATDEGKLYIGAGNETVELARADHLHAQYAAADHLHSQYAPAESPVFTGAPKAPAAATDYTTYRIRNMALLSSTPSSAIGNGQLAGVYE